ncbi:MAG: Hpt domain-containing protein [Planctomycetaceae bacterium]
MPAPVDNTLLELFRTEVELHSETLTAGMQALEQAPADEATLERLMRASHSIKGAARIVQMTPCSSCLSRAT